MSLVNGGPRAENGKKVLEYVLSNKGQALWANAFLQSARPVKLPEEIAAKFLPASEYARATPIDYAKMEQVQKAFADRYLAEVH